MNMDINNTRRFVTGFCDTAQDSVAKRSMYDMAERYGMPLTFVELRHEITHGQIPSVQTLQRHATDALDWLWKEFWVKLVPDPPPTSQMDRIAEQDRIAREAQVVVSTYVAARVAKLKGGAASKKRKAAPAEVSDPGDEACRALVRLCQNDVRNLEVLCAILVQSRKLVPRDYKYDLSSIQDCFFAPTLTSTRLDDSMDGAFHVWDDLMHRLTAHQRDFLQTLVTRMVVLLIEPAEYLDTSQHPFREALFRWLAHIFTADGWSYPRGLRQKAAERLRSEVVGKCVTAPVFWAQRLALVLVESGGKAFRKQWQPVVGASLFIKNGRVAMPGKPADGLASCPASPVVFGQTSALGAMKSMQKSTEVVEESNSMLSGASSTASKQALIPGSPVQDADAIAATTEHTPEPSRRPSIVFGQTSAPGQYTPDPLPIERTLTGGLPLYPVTVSSAMAGPLTTAEKAAPVRPLDLPARGWRRPPGVWRPKPIGLIDLPGDDKYR